MTVINLMFQQKRQSNADSVETMCITKTVAIVVGKKSHRKRILTASKNVRKSNTNLLRNLTFSAIICKLAFKEETMKGLNERIKELRTGLHLSQGYVADVLGINRASFTQIENGNRKVTAEEISKLSELFGVSADMLLNGIEISQPTTAFARSFEKLDERDQAEIMNLIRFKEQMKAQRGN